MRFGKLVFVALITLVGCSPYKTGKLVEVGETHPLAHSIRLSEENSPFMVPDVVPPEIASVAFDKKYIKNPSNVSGMFRYVFHDALKDNNLIASSPELAKFELSAEIEEMSVTPNGNGAGHDSRVTFRLTELKTGSVVWTSQEITHIVARRGIRWGEVLGAAGKAAGSALAGTSTPVAVASATSYSNKTRNGPKDAILDSYQGIGDGFSAMARSVIPKITTASFAQAK